MLLDFAPAVLAFSIALGLFNVPEAGPRPRYSLRGDRAPEIDVLVTCCGEAVEVIRNTVIAAATQDYPLDRLQVYALDDGKNADLCCAIDRVNHTLASRNIKSAPIVYLSRELKPGENSNFKSGNLRFGIKESKARFRDRKNGYISHDECLDSFVAALDADMIPEKNWLKSIVPHLLLDGNLGLACPPQKYYNVPEDPSDTLGQHTDFDIYFSVQEALNDRLGAAMCTGSGYVARRSAVESIGGWPLADCGEDYMCSAMLSDGGWGIAHVREILQRGLAPADMKTLVQQRMRWTDAGVEVHQRLGYYLPGFSAIASRMTPGQRAVNMLYVLRDFSPLGITLAMIALPLAILSFPHDSFADLIHENATSLLWLRRLAVISWLAQKINTWIVYRHIGLARVANFQSQEVWTAPYSAYRNLLALLPKNFSKPNFAVCGATTSSLNECSRRHRKPRLVRLLSPDIVLFTLYICYALSPFFISHSSHFACALASRNNDLPNPTGSLNVFPGATAKLISLAAKVSTPVRYMIWPPEIPEWEELVVEDEDGVKRPKTERKAGKDGLVSLVGLWWLFVWGCEIGVLLKG